MEIHKETHDSKGRNVAKMEDGTEAELTFSIASAHMIIADHTDVPHELNGQGVGKALFLHLLEDARRDNIKIIPLCPFGKAQFGKHPETRDVL